MSMKHTLDDLLIEVFNCDEIECYIVNGTYKAIS